MRVFALHTAPNAPAISHTSTHTHTHKTYTKTHARMRARTNTHTHTITCQSEGLTSAAVGPEGPRRQFVDDENQGVACGEDHSEALSY